MSVAGISSAISAIYQLGQSSSAGKIPSAFQQLGQDLSSGNLAQAQTDYSNLAQTFSPAQPSGPTSAAQAFSQLGKDLQSGNLSAAQQDFTQVRQDLQQSATLHGHGHHHHHGGGSENSSASSSQQVSDAASLFAELGQNLQAGNLSAAQRAYSGLQQDFQQLSASPANNLATQSGTSGLSLTA